MFDKEIKEIVLVIEDNEDDYMILKRYLGDRFELVYCDGQENIIETIKHHKPRCILLDYNLGVTDGITVLNIIKRHEGFEDISVIMLTNEKDADIIVQCMRNKAFHYLMKDKINKNDLDMAVQQAIIDTRLKERVREQQEEIIRLSRYDGLTQIYNRTHFADCVNRLIKKERSGYSAFSLMAMDLDNFKYVNDTFGHLAGDEVLCIAARIISRETRDSDYVCRYGGDEFIIAMMDFTNNSSKGMNPGHISKYDAIRNQIGMEINTFIDNLAREKNIKRNPGSNEVSASMGAVMFNEECCFYELFKAADNALNRVKKNGKDALGYIGGSGELVMCSAGE
ncbi:MAG: diguanylate cyclase [Clostridia bacterium]|nr:diguanylate cyclase [Clostridia bacterium]